MPGLMENLLRQKESIKEQGLFSDRIDLRDEQGHRVQVSKTHTFRHTRATSLLCRAAP
jgi:hypothetical protein